MNVKVVRHSTALSDIEELTSYIAQDNPDAAINLLEAIERTLSLLGQMPQIGSPGEFWSSRLKDVRRLPVTGFERYLIFYKTNSNSIEILRVFHGRREIENLLQDELD